MMATISSVDESWVLRHARGYINKSEEEVVDPSELVLLLDGEPGSGQPVVDAQDSGDGLFVVERAEGNADLGVLRGRLPD